MAPADTAESGSQRGRWRQTISLAASSNQVEFHFKDTLAGAPTLSASTAGLTEATQVETIVPEAPFKLVFTTSPQTVNVDVCSVELTVEVRDTFDNASPVAAATVVNLSSSAGTSLFFGDSACGGASASRALGQGDSQATFYFKDSVVGTPVVTASATGLTDATQTVTLVAAGAASRLAFTTSAQTVNVGACSAVTTVQLQNSLGASVNATSATPVQLTSGAPGMVFFSDSGCASATASVSIAIGGDSTSFYFKDSASGAPLITATASGLTAATQAETIVAPAAALAFTSTQQTLTAGVCSAVITIQSQDSFGNPADVAAQTTVNLTTTSSGGAFYSNTACTQTATSVAIAAGSGTASFYYADSAAGTPTLTASASGLASGTQAENIGAAAASKLVFTTAPQSVVAGVCSAVVTVRSLDTYNNPASVAAVTTVALGSTSSGGTFYAGAGCTGAVTSVSIAAGSDATSFYFKDTAIGSPTITGSATLFNSATQVETVRAAAPARLVFTTTAQTANAGSCSAVMTVELRDGFDNVAPAQAAITVSLSSSAGTSAFFSDPSCSSAVSSRPIAVNATQASFYFKDSAAGSPTVTASSGTLTSATQQVTVVAGNNATKLAFITSAQTLTAGACSSAVTLQSQNSSGTPTNVTSATVIGLSSTSGGNIFYSTAGCSNVVTSVTMASGTNQVSFYFKDTVAGTPTLTASNASLTDATQTQTITAGSGGPRLAFITPQRTTAINSCSEGVTVQTQDEFGNPLVVTVDTRVTLAAEPSADVHFYSNGSCGGGGFQPRIMTFWSGQGISTGTSYMRSTVAGTVTLTATADGYTSATQQATFQ